MTTMPHPTSPESSSSNPFPLEALADLRGARSLLSNHTAWGILNGHEEGGLRGVLEASINTMMRLEQELFLNASPHQRADARHAYANGFRDRSLNTRLGTVELQVPQTRSMPGKKTEPFYPAVLTHGMRSEQALIFTVADIYFSGVSTRSVDAIAKQLGLDGLSSATVSRYAAKLDQQLEAWRQKHLGETPVVIMDARYEKVRVDGVSCDCAVLSAIGIDADGRRSVLGVSVSLSEAEIHWREFFQSLLKRGLCGVRLIISDAHEGLRAARKTVFGAVPWQRCQFHLMQNAMHHCTAAMRITVAAELRKVFDADSLDEANRILRAFVEKYAKTHSKLALWAEENIPEGLTVLSFGFDKAMQKFLRTSNAIERCVQQELKRRTVSVRIFPSSASLLRLVSAKLVELDEKWTDSKRCFKAAVTALRNASRSS
jgi:putative transposase